MAARRQGFIHVERNQVLNERREPTIRTVPLSRCTLEQLVRERDDAAAFYEKHGKTMAQMARQAALEAEIRRRK